MAPFSIDILRDVTPLLALNPAGPFGVLVATEHSGTVRMRVVPSRRQWFIDTENHVEFQRQAEQDRHNRSCRKGLRCKH